MGTRAKESKLFKIFKPSKKKIIVLVILLAAAGVLIYKLQTSSRETAGTAETNLDSVTRGDVEVLITGSGSVEPNERYEIISMVSGDITSSPYDVGDTVQEGDILYQFDTSSTDISMEKQKLSLQQSEISYNNALKQAEDLVITAPCNGVISGLDIKAGDDVTMGQQIAQIDNSRVMKVVLPFNESQISQIWIGLTANITSSSNMGTITGTVVDKASVATPQSDGSKLYDVTIEFTNPGAITDGQSVGGEVNGMISPGSGTVTYSETGVASAEVEGTVTNVYYSNGDYVNKGDTICTLSSETISDNIQNSSISYQNAQLSLQEQEEALEDYSITSPISGTVITRNAKAGDTVDRTNSSTVLMVVADISKLKFNLEIDELDVSKVQEGQTVEITCDALPDETYYGVISQVSVEGTATNGVTTYNAEVMIDNPGNLRPSMNVDASVIVESAVNVLRVPTSDIKTAMGRSFVYVLDDSQSEEDGADKGRLEDAEDMPEPPGDIPEGMEGMPEPPGDMPDGVESMPESSGDIPEDSEGMTGDMPAGGGAASESLPQAPEGFRTVEITTGVSGDDFTEVLSGLSEGDMIYSRTVTSSEGTNFGMMGGGMSGGMGGGMPSGGGGGMGGAPGGGGMGGGQR